MVRMAIERFSAEWKERIDLLMETHPEWGRTIKKDGFLKRSCRNYSYRYELTPPEGEWACAAYRPSLSLSRPFSATMFL